MKARDASSNDRYAISKSLDPDTSELVYCMLEFLNVSPLTVFDGAPSDPSEWSIFFDDILASFTTFLVSDDSEIANQASAVARMIMTDGSTALWRRSKAIGSSSFKGNFWKSS